MNKMHRLLALALVLLLALGMLSSCASTAKSTEEAFAATAWKLCGRSDRPSSVGLIHFTSTDVLASRMQLPEDSVSAVPGVGYAYVFAPSGAGFAGLRIVFLDEVGNVLEIMDYDALDLAYGALGEENPAQKTAYLNTCNYIAFMYTEMLENATPMGADVRMNQWYSLSDEQITAMTK